MKPITSPTVLAVDGTIDLQMQMSTSWRGELTDVFCYEFDPEHNVLQDLAQAIARPGERTPGRSVRTSVRLPDPSELDALLAKPSAQRHTPWWLS